MKTKNDEGVYSNNQKQLASFTEYCLRYPKQRFYQALRNWAKVDYILFADGKPSVFKDEDTIQFINIRDTFYN